MKTILILSFAIATSAITGCASLTDVEPADELGVDQAALVGVEPEEIDVAADGTTERTDTAPAPTTTTRPIKYGPVITIKPKG